MMIACVDQLTIAIICVFVGAPIAQAVLLQDLDNLNDIVYHPDKWKAVHDKISFRQSLVVNPGNPICSGPYYQGQIQDTAPAGTFITRAAATDPNGLSIVWSIPDTSLQRFMINPITGEVFTARNLTRGFNDYSRRARSVLEFLVRATNSASLTCDSLVRVNILITPRPQVLVTLTNQTNTTGQDIPVFGADTFSFTANQCNPGAVVGSLSASSTNSGPIFFNVVQNLDAFNAFNSYNPFGVTNQGVIVVNGGLQPGRTYSFRVQVRNFNGSNTAVVSVLASCNGGYNGGSSCYCGNNLNCVLSNVYSPSYCGNSNTAPTWSNSSFSITITYCAAGSLVGTLTANNNPTSYSLNGNGNYAINNAGQVTVSTAVPVGTQSFVVGATNSFGTAYTLVAVTASCTAVSTGSQGVTTSNSYATSLPFFSQSSYSVTITVCTVGAVVGTIVAANANTYAIISPKTPPTYGINYAGNVTVLNLPSVATFIGTSSETVTVQAINSLGAAYTSLTITPNCGGSGNGYNNNFYFGPNNNFLSYPSPNSLNPTQFAASPAMGNVASDVSPTVNNATQNDLIPARQNALGFSQANFMINAGACYPGKTVGTLSSGNAGITYSIAAGGSGFSLNSQTGILTISGDVLPTQAFLVQAQNGRSSSYATMTVTCDGGTTSGASPVRPVGSFPPVLNDNGPQFSQPSYAFYPMACGSGVIVGSVSARGRGKVTYSGNGLPYWSVDPITGSVESANRVPNFNVFVVTAQDSKGTATATVTITSSCPDYFTFTVTSCRRGAIVVPAGGLSRLSDEGGVRSYALSGPYSDNFRLNELTGQIVSNAPLYSGTYSYVLSTNLRASGNPYTAHITLLVTCGGISVSFTYPEYQFRISCSKTPHRVGIVSATASNRESITYSLGAINNLFYIDPSSGELRTQLGIRTELEQKLTVRALSASGVTATANVAISISGGRCL